MLSTVIGMLQLQGFCQTLSGQGAAHTAACMSLAKALVRYDQLLLLLRGKLPPDLLPPVPPGYVWSRVQVNKERGCKIRAGHGRHHIFEPGCRQPRPDMCSRMQVNN